MNHYPHHIGDFDKATRHLTRIERSIYRDLIELYYDTETQLPLDLAWICRKVIARSDEESTAVEQTLNEFFTKTPTGWYHARCEEEIEAYRSNTSQKALAGKASAVARALKKQQALNARSTDVATPVQQTSNGTPTNQEPRTKNQEPEGVHGGKPPARPRKSKPKDGLVTLEDLVAEGVNPTHAESWLLVRHQKGLPLTKTAWEGVKAQAQGVSLPPPEAVRIAAENSWGGFKATWYQNQLAGDALGPTGARGAAPPINRQVQLEQRNAAIGEAWARGDLT